jgi:secreted trypsin-like serine protease
VGVTSYGDQTCTQFGVDTRVDAYRSFISSAIQQ